MNLPHIIAYVRSSEKSCLPVYKKNRIASLLCIFVCFVCLFVFVALRPMSTAMVIAGRSVHLTTLFPGQA